MTGPAEFDTPVAWQDEAACEGMDREQFYIPGDVPRNIAAICRTCPVQRQCLDFAMKIEGTAAGIQYRFGVWGGTSAKDRARMARGGWLG